MSSRTARSVAFAVVLGVAASPPGIVPARARGAGQPGPGGEATVSVSLKGAELQEFLRLIAEVADVNVVVDPAVARRAVTMTLTDVPWARALDAVLASQGLAAHREGRVVRVAPASRFLEEHRQRAALREARESAGELQTVVRTLSHADARTAARLVQSFLSPRGQVVADPRTNTLIIRDVAPRAAEASRLLAASGPAPPVPRARAALILDAVVLEADAVTWRRAGLPPPGTTAHPHLARDAAGAAALTRRLLADPHVARAASRRIVLGLDEEASLGPAAGGVTITARRDGARTVAVVRPLARPRAGWHAPATRVQLVRLPTAAGGRERMLVLAPLAPDGRGMLAR